MERAMVAVRIPIKIKTPYKRGHPGSRCIHCGRVATKLRKEQIIPYGLAPDSLVFPKAGCLNCQEKTDKFGTH